MTSRGSKSYPRWLRSIGSLHWEEGIGSELWPRERDLVDWLASNIDQLGRVVGMQLTVEGREVPVGHHWMAGNDRTGHRFRVGGGRLDLDLRNGSGQRVIVEAQLGKTDHAHLGQLISYAHHAKAPYAIWLLASKDMESDEPFTPDHLETLAELNELYAGSRIFMLVHAVAETAQFYGRNFGVVPLLPFLRRVDPAVGYYMSGSSCHGLPRSDGACYRCCPGPPETGR